MSHVDEGALHAYLDGALDAYPASEAAFVREHLEHCAACAARLDEARALRDRAASVLSLVEPGAVDMPPLEELRRRAAAGAGSVARPGRIGRMRRMAWAASVVLALGTGWVLRDRAPGMADEAARTSRPESAEAAPPPPPVEAEEVREAPDVPETTPDAQVLGAPAAAGPASAARLREADPDEPAFRTRDAAPADATVAERGQAVATGDTAPAGLDIQPPASAPDSTFRMRLEPSGLAPVVVTGTAVPSMDSLAGVATGADSVRARELDEALRDPGRLADRLTLADQAAASGQRREREDLDPAARIVEEAGRGAAASARQKAQEEPGSLVVPGLEVLSVSWIDVAGFDEAAVRVLQRLESGDTLEVFHLPPGAGPELAPTGPEGRTLVAVDRPTGWLVLRAASDRALLDALARRLLGG
ncbi:MAG: zf-HC2 domain-containing protein [Longimicrobiales bacterium]